MVIPLLFLLLCVSVPDVGGDRPNIIWLTVEDMSPWLGCYGDDTVPTPHVDALAARGTRYTNAFATAPVCAPARSTLITGCYATSIGAMHMRTGKPSRAGLARDPGAYDDIPSYEAVPPPEVRCFPELLRAQGYWCTNASKQDYQFAVSPTVWDQSGKKAHWKNRPDPAQPFFAVFNYVGTHESGTFEKTHRRKQVVDPSDVTLPPYYPDTPRVRADLARTYDNIAAMDTWVGQRMAELDEAGVLDNTIIFYFSDHGVGLPRGKRCLYDSGTRVPLIVAHPGAEPATSDRVVSFVDLAPTVLSVAGGAPPDWMMGDAFDGVHVAPAPGLAFMQADRMDAVRDRSRAVSDGRYRYIRNDRPQRPRLYFVAYADNIPMMADLKALKTGDQATAAQWQIVDATKPREELYDTQQDPHEVVNRIDDPALAQVRDRLRAALESWSVRTGDLGAIPETELVRTRLWPPDGIQPTTAMPQLHRRADGSLELICQTPGASIGWRAKGETVWRVAVVPLPLEPGTHYQAIAHRIGFKRSPVIQIPTQ